MRIISVTPAGRRRYLSVQAQYLLRNRGVISQHWYWVNTKDEDDIAYIEQLCLQEPEFFKSLKKPMIGESEADGIWQYYRHCTDEDTIYIRLDDDIVFIEDGAIERLIQCRLRERQPFLIYGNIVNNAICSHIQQQRGLLSSKAGVVENACTDPLGWRSPLFACGLHALFLTDVALGRTSRWQFPDVAFKDYRRFSVNVICWFGADMASISEIAIDDLTTLFDSPIDERTGSLRFRHAEESFLTQDIPERLQRPAYICGDAVFVHFAFFMQRKFIERYTALLPAYTAVPVMGRVFFLHPKVLLSWVLRGMLRMARGVWRTVSPREVC